MFRRHAVSPLAAVGALTVALVLTGCSAVKKDEFNSTVAQLREESQAGDEALRASIAKNDQSLSQTNARVDALQRDLQALRTEFDAKIQQLAGAMKFNVPVHFAFNSATVREADRPLLDRFAGVVREFYPEAKITIEGFADPAGSAEYNRDLGQRRAQAVRDYLVRTAGLPADRLRTVSYGESSNRQIVPGAQGPGNRGLENRRVALVIDYSGQPGANANVAVQ